ncbi:MAG TPA: potassium transporter Kup [Longimicrobium sp.]|nr:potassium transporter Kup [Longimicrobium sp.]
MTESHPHGGEPKGRYLYTLALGALGVVYGDIGTSPLYALRECFHHSTGIRPTHDNVLGILSLIVWSLILVVSVKYLMFVMRADNRGEGGILALLALVAPPRSAVPRGSRRVLLLMGVFGAALLYGDGMITPAITVLSAVEGLNVATPFFEPYIILISIVILVGLFLVQSRGTAAIGRIFGPVMLVWFFSIAAFGLVEAVRKPQVFLAVSPHYAVGFMLHHGYLGFLVLGSVFLVVTGGEALYADMGHFGKNPIRMAWFSLALPALLLNYFGQGALILRDPAAVEHPFFRLTPGWALYPMVALATAAAVIASQALISGAFSLTRQAVQLGYSPRVDVDHTSEREIGQIYIPGVNRLLMVACIALVLGFRSSSNLAAAYGIAVTGTMGITTVLFYFVARERFGWTRVQAGVPAAFFLVIDLAFFLANATKIAHGGWFPLLVGAVVFTAMTTWKTGRRILAQRLSETTLPIALFLEDVRRNTVHRVPGTAVFMSSSRDGTPPALLHSLKHYKVLHKTTVFLSVETREVPHVTDEERIEVQSLGEGFFRVVLGYGFMEDPNVPLALAAIREPGLDLRPGHTTFFLGRETLIPSKRPGMAVWREQLFAVMSRNARTATSFFGLPPNRVVELGAQIEL